MNFRAFSFDNISGYIWPAAAYFIVLPAVFITAGYRWQYMVVASLMLLLPLFDKKWQLRAGKLGTAGWLAFLATVILAVVILVLRSDLYEFALMTLLFAAIPEEWFFRAYLLRRAGGDGRANLVTSLLFSLLHAVSWGWLTGLLVFIPSLIFGWLYQKSHSLILVIAVHAVSNLLYVAFLASFIG